MIRYFPVATLALFITLSGCKKENPAEVDTQAPAISLVFPAPDASLKADTTYTLIATAEDNVGIAKVEFWVNDIKAGTDTLSPYEYRWNTWQLSGTHAITLKAYDSHGNVGTSQISTVLISGRGYHPPNQAGNPLPADSGVWEGSALTLRWSGSDPDRDVLTYDVYFGADSSSLTRIGTNLKTAQCLCNTLAIGTIYYWRVDAKGSAGGVSTGRLWKFTRTAESLAEGMVRLPGRNLSIDKYEMTVDRWNKVSIWGLAHGYPDLETKLSTTPGAGDRGPVAMVNWYDVVKWCNARSEMDGYHPVYYTDSEKMTVYRAGECNLTEANVDATAYGYRLPTDAEWSLAAAGGSDTTHDQYSGSDDINLVGWYASNSGNVTHSGGRKLPNALGIYDMTGNVAEWCFTYGCITFLNGGVWGRSIRGGSYSDEESRCTNKSLYNNTYTTSSGNPPIQAIYTLYGKYPYLRDAKTGFRCVRD